MSEPTHEAYEAAAGLVSWRKYGARAQGRLDALEDADSREVVDAVWKIAEATVRAKVAAEIRDAKPDVVLLTGHPFGEDERMITLDRAARIAEGKGDETP